VHADCHWLGYSPVNGKLYAGNDGGIYSTSNGGTTWTDHTETMTIGQIYKLGQSQTVKEKVINGFQDNGTYTYLASGWVATGGGDGMECAVDYTNAAWTYHTIYYGDIFRKYNNGSEYHIAGEGMFGITESGGWITPFILHETNPECMFVGYKNIWRSTNILGYSIVWDKISDLGATSNMDALEQSPANTSILYAVRSNSKLYRSDDCMSDNPGWLDISAYLPGSGTPTDVECHPTDENTVYMTQGNNVYKSVDKGITWTDISGTLPDIHLSSIAYYKNAIEGLYVASDAGVFYRDATLTDWIPFSDGFPANARMTEVDIYYNPDTVANDAIRASTYGRGLWGSDMYHSAPDADFSADKTLVPPGCGINFTDLSTGVPTNWLWTFEGGTPCSSTAKHPEGVTYSAAGTYSVKMVASNTEGIDSILKISYITVSDTLMPVAGFTVNENILCTGETAYFTDLSENCPASWQWQFSPPDINYMQGTNQYSQNPVVIFTSNGEFTVTLTVTNSVGTISLTKQDYIIHGGYMLPFEDGFESGFEAQNWSVSNPDYAITWDTISAPGVSAGNKAAWMNFHNYLNITKRDRLISPALDFSDFSAILLNFRHAYAQRSSLKDSLVILVSGDCGSTWNRVFSAGPNGTPDQFVTHEPMMEAFYPQSIDDWCSGSYGVDCYQVDLNAWSGLPNIKLAFESYNRSGNNLFIDDITISGLVAVNERKHTGTHVSVFPNPAEDEVTITMTAEGNTVTITLLNMQGQSLFTLDSKSSDNHFTEVINLQPYPDGVYFLRLVTGNESIIKKVIKQ
jgi:PKD repeat protein